MIGFGFPAGLKQIYPAVEHRATHFFSIAAPGDTEWAQEVLYQTGKAVISLQLVEGIKAGLVTLTKPSSSKFLFRYNHAACGIEYFDKLDDRFVRQELTERINKTLSERCLLVSDDTEALMNQSLSSPQSRFISYDAPAEVWELFLERASYQLLLVPGSNDFGPNDVFGGIQYFKYYDALRYLTALSLMHTHYCQLLSERSPDIDLGVILTHIEPASHVVGDMADFLEISIYEAEVVLGCLCLSPENHESYLDEPSVPPPPYIRISDSQLIRSSAGCLTSPFGFLNRMLKHKYALDYSKAVNEREDRFIEDLCRLFEGARFIRVKRPVNIRSDKGNTDIDAVIYDTYTKALGLFQLKWQDPLGESVRLRRTKAENLFKANEWVDKVCSWLHQRSGAEILTGTHVMRKRPSNQALGEVFLFVLGRHNIHFTNGRMDTRAVWASWQGILASQARVAAFMEDDPIRMMYTKLRIYGADDRIRHGETPPTEYDMQLGPYRIEHLNH